MGRWKNNRAENSHLPFRRKERFRRMKSLQKFASVHANVHNHFNAERHLIDRQTYKTCHSAALAEWQNLMGRRICGQGMSLPIGEELRLD